MASNKWIRNDIDSAKKIINGIEYEISKNAGKYFIFDISSGFAFYTDYPMFTTIQEAKRYADKIIGK